MSPSETTEDVDNTSIGEAGPGSLSRSSIEHYLLLENRRSLLGVSKKLTQGDSHRSFPILWQLICVLGLSFGSTNVHHEDFWGEVCTFP